MEAVKAKHPSLNRLGDSPALSSSLRLVIGAVDSQAATVEFK